MCLRAAAAGAIAHQSMVHRQRSTTASRGGRGAVFGKPYSTSWRIVGDRQKSRDRFHAHQGASLGLRRKRGEQTQAIGRSRGGRNTKIHAIADAKGRLLSFLLTGGEAHDCPVAERLIRRTKAAEELLADKAYDSDDLRGWLGERGTKAVIPNKSNRKRRFSFNKKSYRRRHLVE